MTLDNPHQMFDVTGKVALITGASGAFGAVAARCLSAAAALDRTGESEPVMALQWRLQLGGLHPI